MTKKGIMIRWTNLETRPNRDVFIFWIHASAFAIRRAIDVLQSMNQKRRWRILQITSLRHFIYSTNAQAYSDLNFWDIVGGGGGGGVFGELCVPPEESWLRPWFNQPFGEELSSYSSTVFFVFTAVIFIWVSSLRKQPFLLAPRRCGRFARRIVCDSATEIPYWWRKISPESGHKRWLDDGVVTFKQ